MNPRPILKFLPDSLKERIFYKLFNNRQSLYKELFHKANLLLAPDYKMYDLVVGDVISGQIALNGFYEYKLSKEISKLSKSGGLFVDVGANLGYFTLLWLYGNEENHAIAVEASPRNQEIINKNLVENRVESKVTLFRSAAGDANKEVTFDLGPETQTGWGGINSGIDGTISIKVDMIRIDNVINDEIEVMKIDVEGADTLVIKGCEALLADKKIHRIYFEQNRVRMERLGIQEGAAIDFLRSYGYTCEPFNDAKDEWLARID